MNTEANREVVLQFYDCLTRGDAAGAIDLLDPQVEIDEPPCLPYGGIYRGLDGVGQLFGVATTLLNTETIQVESVIADGDRVVGMLRSKVVGSEEPVLIAEESELRDGKIFRVRVFHFDPSPVIHEHQRRQSPHESTASGRGVS